MQILVDNFFNTYNKSIAEVKSISDGFYAENGRLKKSFIATYGCQMNEHDSEKLEAMLTEMGYDKAANMEDADFVLFNTCCIRENAEFKVYGNLGRVWHRKKQNPDIFVAVCGCMMQRPHIVEQIKEKYRYVDLVFGTHNLHDFPGLLERALTKKTRVIEVLNEQKQIVEGLPVIRKKSSKAYVNIMYGCNNFCTFCIVPHTRGREKSRRPGDIINEITELAAAGTKEVMLLGQNVNSYGREIEGIDFADLLKMINNIEGIERIRFMTSHPKDISKKLIDTMARCSKVCNYLHLPVQSGDNELLRRMNRGYTIDHYMEMIEYARDRIPGIGISTDIIVGFPGETDSQHQATIDLVKKVRYDSAFTYIYSSREGTPAAKFTGHLDDETKSARIAGLIAEINPIIKEKLAEHQGEVMEVLVEARANKNEKTENTLMGRTASNLTVTFEALEGVPVEEHFGKLMNIKITRPKNFSLYGEIVSEGL